MSSDNFWAVASLIGGAAFVAYWVYQRVHRQHARKWPSETGRVESTKIAMEDQGDQQVHAAYVMYSYDVAGQSHSGQLRRWFILEGRAKKWTARFPDGAQVQIRYNPQNAADSLLFEDEQATT